MTDEINQDAANELRILRAEMAAIRSHVEAIHKSSVRVPVQHGWLKHVVKDLETNPHTQYKVHLYGAIYWLINFPLVCYLFFGLPQLWLKLGIFITLMYSIYANFATDYGSMSAAMASFSSNPLPEIPVSAHIESGIELCGHG